MCNKLVGKFSSACSMYKPGSLLLAKKPLNSSAAESTGSTYTRFLSYVMAGYTALKFTICLVIIMVFPMAYGSASSSFTCFIIKISQALIIHLVIGSFLGKIVLLWVIFYDTDFSFFMHCLYYRSFQWIEYHQIPDMMQHHKSRKEPVITDGHISGYFQRALQQTGKSLSVLKQERFHQVSLCNLW